MVRELRARGDGVRPLKQSYITKGGTGKLLRRAPAFDVPDCIKLLHFIGPEPFLPNVLQARTGKKGEDPPVAPGGVEPDGRDPGGCQLDKMRVLCMSGAAGAEYERRTSPENVTDECYTLPGDAI